jgi:hypothetical protein
MRNIQPPLIGRVEDRTALIVEKSQLREPNLLIPGKKPVGPVQIDWSNDMTSKLLVCLPFTETSSHSTYDLAQNKILTFTGTEGISGQDRVFNGTDTYLTVCEPSLLYGTDITIFLVSKNANLNDNSVFGSAANTNTSVDRINVHLPYSGRVFWDYGTLDSSDRVSVANTISTTEFSTWAFTATSNFMGIWKDSALLTSSAASIGRFNSSSNPLILGAFIHTNIYYPGTIKAFYIFKRRLLDAEIVSLTADPYQFLVPA